MSSQPWLYFDDTASEIEYSPSQDWASTTHARAETGLAVFNDTLTATASAQANIHIEFTASQITIIGATLALPEATEDGTPLSSYVLDGSKNTAFVFRGDLKNDTSVVFFVSETLPEQRHSLDITVLSASGSSPFLFDRIALLGPQNVPATSTVVWVTTAFPTPSAASQNTTIINVQDHSLPVGAIVGGVVGGIALIVAILLAFYLLFWRNRRYGTRGFESEAFNADAEKYRLTSRNSGVPPDLQAAQMEPFLAPQYPQQYPAQYPAQYADYPHPASAPSIDPRASMYSAPALSPPITATTATAVGAPQFYPSPSSVVSSSAYSASSGRALTVVNDAAIAAAAGGFAALTSAERKEAEAKAESSLGESSKPVQFHRDSGVRFDNEGRPVQPEDDDAKGSGSGVKHDPQPLADVPPEYSEL